MDSYWRKQAEQALFDELEWDKPERRDQAGRLLIIGGNLHALSAPAKAYEYALTSGMGDVKIILPDKTKKLVGKALHDAVFLPSTPSGELSHEGSSDLLHLTQWADSLLLPGDIGRNSQTTILLEEILKSYSDLIILTRDAFDSLSGSVTTILSRPKTTLVLSFAQLQKLVKNSGETKALQFSMDLTKLVEFLHTFSQKYSANFITLHQKQLIVAVNGQISTTKLKIDEEEPPHWRINYSVLAACYQTWQPFKTLEALTHAAYLLKSKL